MLPFADRTITIYNKLEKLNPLNNKTVTHWVRQVVKNCTWAKRQATVTIGNTELASDDIVIKMPKDARFLTHSEFVKLDLEQAKAHFTLHVGDVVFLGELTEEIADNDSPNELMSIYEDNITINSFENYAYDLYPLQHYQITGV